MYLMYFFPAAPAYLLIDALGKLPDIPDLLRVHHIQECQKHLHIKMLHLVDHHLHRSVGIERRPVRPLRDQRGIHIADPQDSRRKRDFISSQIVRITSPVKIFMVMVHSPEHNIGKIAQLLKLPVA